MQSCYVSSLHIFGTSTIHNESNITDQYRVNIVSIYAYGKNNCHRKVDIELFLQLQQHF